LVAAGGVGLLTWARQKRRSEAWIGGALLVGAPWLFDDVGKLLGFAGGVAATLWVVLRIQKD
jgi:hypothetical protein